MSGMYRVFLGACDSYDPTVIAGVIGRGLVAVGFNRPFAGKVVIKPNVVFAHQIVAPNAYTRPEVIAGLLEAASHGGDRARISIVEKSGTGASTMFAFRRAGYRALAARYGARLVAVEEHRKVRIPLRNGKFHRSVALNADLATRDLLVFMPKLKTNVLADGLTASIKLNVGNFDEQERMIGHDFHLPDKMVDLLEVACPDLIVTDAIDPAVGGNQMTEHAVHLGAIIIATNPVAHDLVAAVALNRDPARIAHLQAAIARGYGPRSLDEVEVVGDLTLAELQARSRDFDLGVTRIEQFPGSFRFLPGQPECRGGCHGIFLDWLYMIKDCQPAKLTRLPRLAVVLGDPGDALAEIEESHVLLVGNCALAAWRARCSRSQARSRRAGVTAFAGCPPTHRTIILMMGLKRRLFGPFFRPDLIVESYLFNVWGRFKGRLRNLGLYTGPDLVPGVGWEDVPPGGGRHA